MNIKLKFFGFPEVLKMLGKNELDVQVKGATIGDLQHQLEETYGEGIKKIFTVQILRNGQEWIKMNDRSHPLGDGDQLSFLNMITGG
jgi:molybdopterin converting factor small subunit